MTTQLTDREIDFLVQERVFGWTPLGTGGWLTPERNTVLSIYTPTYTTDASADFVVLAHVRDTWHGINRMWFNVKLKGILQQHGLDDPLLGREDTDDVPLWDSGQYHPGDWSKAALMALGVEL